ncbi:MAG: sulfotransferase family protein [Actinomycetota bacterium]
MRIKVFYILGTTRSGSTILENVMGNVPGFAAAGEIHMLWRGIAQGFTCGCGAPVTSCPVWSDVLRRAGADGLDPREVWDWQLREVRILHTPRLLRQRSWPVTGRPTLDRYTSLLAALYPAIGAVTGARVVVDSSKSPAALTVLSHIDGLELYVALLVRDPRAVAYSWRRGAPSTGRGVDDLSYRPGPARVAGRWVATNLLGERVGRRLPSERFMVLRYEDFVAEPKATVERLVRFAGEEPPALPFVSERTAALEPNHTVSGNRSRFATGEVEIRLDDAWMREASALRRVAVTSLTLPWLGRYGYPVRLPRRG